MTLALHGKSPQRRTALILIALFALLAATAAGVTLRSAGPASAAGTTNWSGPAAVAGGVPSCSNLTGAFGIEDNTFATCDAGERLVLSEYGLADQMPANAIGLGVVVVLRANSGSPDGLDTFSFELSGDGGATYTAPFTTPDVNRPASGEWGWHFPAWETCGGFGKVWTIDEFSDANFRVRATANVNPAQADDQLLLEGIFIKVCWTTPEILGGPDVSLSAGSTTGDSAAAGEAFSWILTTYNFPALLEPLNLSVVVPDGFQITGIDTTTPGFDCEPAIGQELECFAQGDEAIDRQLSIHVTAPDGNPASECGPHTIHAAISGGGGTISIPAAQHTVTVTCLLVPPPPPGPLDPVPWGTLLNRKVIVGGTSDNVFSIRVDPEGPANGFTSTVQAGVDSSFTVGSGQYFVDEFNVSGDFVYLGSLVAVGALAAPVCPQVPPATGLGTNVNVPAGGTALVCHYNQKLPKGTIINRKIVVNEDTDQFFQIVDDGAGETNDLYIQMNENQENVHLTAPGQYTVFEKDVPPGYAYLGALIAVGPPTLVPQCPAEPPATGAGVSFNLAANQTVIVCHYNTKIPMLAYATIENRKVLLGGGPNQVFEVAVDGPGAAGYTGIFDPTDPSVQNVGTFGAWNATESNVPAGFEYLGAILLTPSTPNCPATPPNTGAGVNFSLAKGDHVVICHYNRRQTNTTTPTPTPTPGFTPTPTGTPPATTTVTPPATTTASGTTVPTTPEPIVREPEVEPTPIAPSTGETAISGTTGTAGIMLGGVLLALAGLAAGGIVLAQRRR